MATPTGGIVTDFDNLEGNWWESAEGRRRWQSVNPGRDVDRWARREQTRSTSFYQQAQALFPGLPEWVLISYARGLAEHGGDANLAWSRVRDNSNYDKTFTGNRRDDGSLRMTELEYLAVKDGFAQTLADYGVNPSVFESQFADLIGGDVSVDEFKTRLDAVHNGVVNNTPEVQAKFRQWYGAPYNPQLGQQQPSVAMAMALNPDVGKAILDKRITMAQIAGEAAQSGFGRSRLRAGELFRQGVTQQTANQLYSEAAMALPTLDALAKRHNDADRNFGIGEFEDAFLGDADQKQRAQRLVEAEAASFSGGGRVARDQSGGLSGLRQQ